MAKYPKPMSLVHDGDSTLIYETGPRTLDYPPTEEKLDEFIEENEGEADGSWEAEERQHNVLWYPRDRNVDRSFPDPLEWDVKVVSGTGFLDKLKPSVKDIFDTVHTLADPRIQKQLVEMVRVDPLWAMDARELLRFGLGNQP